MKLYPFQKEGVERIKGFDGRVLLADSMGLGKTVQALSYLTTTPGVLPAVVVCPASVKFVWEQEAERMGVSSIVLSGRAPYEVEPVDLYIINYDILVDKVKIFRNGRMKVLGGAWLKTLRRFQPQTIIIDECHFAKNPKSKRTKAIKKLCRKIPHVLALSGTPMTNRPAELWPTLNLLRPDVWPAFWPFAQSYCGLTHGYFGWDWSGATNLDKLNVQLTKYVMIRRRKEDVLKDLPAKLRDTVPCEMRKPIEYQEAETDFAGWLQENYGPDKKPMALTKVGYLLRLAAKLKARAVIRWINEFLESSDEKLVVFAKHHKMIDAIVKHVDYRSVTLDGRMSADKKKDAVTQFQQDKKIRLFVGNIKAAGVGITLTAASTVAFTELDWVPSDLNQAEDRCHRIGQEHPVWVHYLIAKGTVEERLCAALIKKQAVMDKAIDGTRTIDNFDLFAEILGGFR